MKPATAKAAAGVDDNARFLEEQSQRQSVRLAFSATHNGFSLLIRVCLYVRVVA